MLPARLLSLFVAAALAVPSCRSVDDDDVPVDNGVPPPSGKGDRLHDIANPSSDRKAAHLAPVVVTGVVVVAADDYDETGQGNSANGLYVADLGSQEPYSGISLFNASFLPGNLRVGAGDALDLRGVYQENTGIPSTPPIKFAPGAFLPQIGSPIATFRYDAHVPDPVDIDVEDLQDFAKGRRWMNMLVRVKNVTLQRNAFPRPASGRISAGLLPETNTARGCEDPFPKAPTLVNELMDIAPLELAQGQTIQSIVGVVTFFCNFHVAPRTAADIVK